MSFTSQCISASRYFGNLYVFGRGECLTILVAVEDIDAGDNAFVQTVVYGWFEVDDFNSAIIHQDVPILSERRNRC